MKERSFDTARSSLLIKAMEVLGNLADHNEICIGGGTVLASRWHHRLSTDIDLFTSPEHYRSLAGEILAHMRSNHRDVNVTLYPHMMLCVLPDGGEWSLGGSANVTPRPLCAERERQTGLQLQSTCEILTRKVRARMVNNTLYLGMF